MNGRVPIVLLIEHDALQRGTMARILKAAGYCVIPVGRAHEALETFSTHHVDIALVVADTQTQSLSGPPLLDALCSIDRLVPVLALSDGVAINRPAYEYPNVAATLMRPFEPSDVLAHVDHVLRSTAFNWPPTEEDLADIHVVDTTAWQQPQSAPVLPQAPAEALMTPFADGHALVKPSSAPLMAVTRDELTSAPRLAIHGLARRPWVYDFKLPLRTRRSVGVAATAICGLALTTLLELRGVPATHDPEPLMAEAARDTASLPLLSAREHRADALPLVSARRVTPRTTADVLGIRRQPAPMPEQASSNASMRLTRALPTELRSGGRPKAPEPARATAVREEVAARVTPPASITPTTPTASSSPESPALRDTATADAAAREAPARNAAARDAARAEMSRRAELAARNDAAALDAATAGNVPASAPVRPRDDERGIYQALQQYEHAYERLDVNAARAVWPSLNTRALTRAFEGLKAQALEFSNCRVAMELPEATAICGGSASYVPRVGRQATRTEPREWTFHLRKIDRDWLIAKAEVR